MNVIQIVLTRNISYKQINGNIIKIPKNTIVILDPRRNIAFYNDEHFTVDSRDFKVLYPH